MPSWAFQRVDLDLAYAPFRDELFEVVAELAERDLYFVCTELYRTPKRSDELAHDAAVGIAAGAGDSAHNFGLGADFVRSSTKDGHVTGNYKAIDYVPLGRAAVARGRLVWGGLFRGGTWDDPTDAGHLNLRGWTTHDDLAPLRAIVRTPEDTDQTYLARVWAEVDARSVLHAAPTS